MYRFTKDGVSVSVVLDTRRAKNNGKYPVKVEVVHLRRQKYYATGKDLDKSEWQKLSTAKARNLVDIREQIEASYNIVRDYVRDLTTDGNFTFDALNLRLKGAVTADVNTAIKMRVERMKAEERYNGASVYVNVIRSIEAFAGSNILYAHITPQWLRRYEEHLRNKGNSQNTIHAYITRIRTIMNEAQKMGIIKPSANPFNGGYKVQKGSARKLALTLAQIKQIANYEGSPAREKHRDYWLFMYLCNGINATDLARLKYSDIQDGEITFVRRKTATTSPNRRVIRVVITPQMQAIIERYGNKPHPDAYIFPFLNNSKKEIDRHLKIAIFKNRVNRAMKAIGKELGIGNISTYTARHSFATILKRAGTNIAYISEALGHTNLAITETYLASFERDEREKNARLLTAFDSE